MNGSDYSTTTLPLLFVFISFVVTFLVTRLIRAGKGPFKDNVTEDGVHVRHAVYGIFALLAGAVMNTAAESSVFRVLGAILSARAPRSSSTSSRGSCTCATCTKSARGTPPCRPWRAPRRPDQKAT